MKNLLNSTLPDRVDVISRETILQAAKFVEYIATKHPDIFKNALKTLDCRNALNDLEKYAEEWR